VRASPFVVCAGLFGLAFLISLAVGSENLFSLGLSETAERILLQLRLPGAALVAIAGAALGGSGAAYQGLFRNPLADPFLIGVAPGAGLGAVIAMVSGFPVAFIPACALLGALVTVATVYRLARVGKSAPVTTLLLSGIAVGSFTSALTSYLMLERQLEMRRVFNFLMGGFSLGGWEPVWAALPYTAAGLAILMAMGRPLNVLQFGDEQASQLGLDVERAKLLLIVAASLAAASAVAFKGIIGFVGLIAPHLVRLLWGPDHRRLVPLSALAGAAGLLLADTAGRSVSALMELPVGIVTALVGAPFFLYLLRRVRQSYW